MIKMFYTLKNYLTASFKVLPALKTGDFIAGILIDSPVLGFTPFLAALSETLKAQKPVILTSFQSFNSFVVTSIIAASALLTAS
jgi:hypothetical protein